ncbi:TIGR04086 family membrane protein [Candidatus Nitrospira neomarina]|uniref:PhnA-like protein n=1 Tax=Candidatus Nitrospira neomarina TaxID=3020899 RepID=A0AA96K557_9BACT|nr:hypothetical protein [Candidatus Nitrospira neomarina]WNM64109.1 hypothetical protein PQG83_10235 [Candidatus Nitrospira neomarina]
MAIVTTQEPRDYLGAAVKRISWAAIFAGIITVLVVQLSLSLFGIGIGASTIDPLSGETPAAGSFSIGAAIWWVVVSIIALFAGGWVAGRLAGMPNQTDGLLHGFITWGAATLVAVYFLISTAGSILGGTFGVLGDALSATGQGMAALAPNVSDFATKQLSGTDMTWDDIKQEAQLLLQQTGKEELQPGTLKTKAMNTSETMEESVQQSATKPQQTDEELMTILDRIIGKGQDVVSEVDKKALTNVLVARTDMSRQEAEQTVQRWMDTYQTATTKLTELQGQARQQALEAADATAEAVSQASIWTFISLVFGASAAAIGGVVGAPRDIVTRV